MKYAIEEKLQYRQALAQKISITRLDYMIRVLRTVFNGKHTIPDPDSFKEKVKQVERAERRKAKREALEEGLMTMKSASSFGASSYL